MKFVDVSHPHLNHIAIPALVGVFVAMLGGWLLWSSRADAEPANGLRTYTANDFAIDLPVELNPSRFPREDDSQAFLFESSDGSLGFQVFTMPFSGPTPLTPDILHDELPDLTMNDLMQVTIGGEPALSFKSDDPDIGDTAEVWFVHNGVLYQVMTYPSLRDWLSGVLQTWRFR